MDKVTYLNHSVADICALRVGNLAGIFPDSFPSVTVENLQGAGEVGGFDIVFVRRPDGFSVLHPADVNPLTPGECALQCQRVADFIEGVSQFSHKANRL